MDKSPPLPTASPNPHASFRPSPIRSNTLSTSTFPYHSARNRATSQPAGEKLPASNSNPDSGRGSPLNTHGNGNGTPVGTAFGVIGGTRTPVRYGNGLVKGNGTATRANSFSAGEGQRDSPRNTSMARTLSAHIEEHPSTTRSNSGNSAAFPTFSPESSPASSPAIKPNTIQAQSHSPPRAGASRSRSQSLAGGPRPMGGPGLGSFMMPMSTLENSFSRGGGFRGFGEKNWEISPPEGSNMSPFTRGYPSIVENDRLIGSPDLYGVRDRFRNQQDAYHSNRNTSWPSVPAPNSALSSSVAEAFGGFSSITGGFDDPSYGGRSGTSSRRHSVSVVGGPGGRRGFGFSDGGGMSAMASPPNAIGPGRGLGPSGFSDADLLPEKLGNALNLEIDESRRRGVELEVPKKIAKETPQPSSLPVFNPLGGTSEPNQPRNLSMSVPRGRGTVSDAAALGAYGTSPRGRSAFESANTDRAPSGESKDSSSKSRFSFDAPSGSPSSLGTSVGGTKQPSYGNLPSPSPDRGRELPGMPFPRGPGPIGPPMLGFDGRNGYPPNGPYRPDQYMPRNGYQMGPPSPLITPLGPQGPYNRPPPFFGGQMPQRPPFSPNQYQNPPNYGQPQNYQQPYFAPPPPNPQVSPSSFSSLSLSDLGKGLSLTSLSPSTPLYIVTFKAGRRDVFYCPDPTLLISNGDRVIVEADRGSDLGTVIYDQLTPVEVRDWQERQATAALLSGASQHQPPGMAVPGQNGGSSTKGKNENELDELLGGVGSGTQMELNGMPSGRGPLAKEIMPKRIFAKAGQGPEEQQRMMEKLKDEYDAMMICREKVVQRGLPMQIVDAEYQWDRRKLTFYFKADKRVDFRDLTKENFRIFKSRIWMSMVPRDDPRSG